MQLITVVENGLICPVFCPVGADVKLMSHYSHSGPLKPSIPELATRHEKTIQQIVPSIEVETTAPLYEYLVLVWCIWLYSLATGLNTLP